MEVLGLDKPKESSLVFSSTISLMYSVRWNPFYLDNLSSKLQSSNFEN